MLSTKLTGKKKKKNEEILRFRKMTSKSKILQTGLKHK